jgi:hypothetical protein
MFQFLVERVRARFKRPVHVPRVTLTKHAHLNEISIEPLPFYLFIIIYYIVYISNG